MNATIRHAGLTIDLDMYETPWELKGKGWVHHARVVGKANRDDLTKLIGLTLWGDPVLGVESFATPDQSNKNIGLLMSRKLW